MVERFVKLTTEKLKNWLDRMLKEVERKRSATPDR
jgi:hypothetical protein